MASFFNLELDTTPPRVEIIAPNYTSSDIITSITIESDKDLMQYQEIYYVDSTQRRHDLTFSQINNSIDGKIQFSTVGFITLYCRLKDDVGNVSELVSKSINVTNGLSLKSVVSIFERITNIFSTCGNVGLTTKVQNLNKVILPNILSSEIKKQQCVIQDAVKNEVILWQTVIKQETQ